MNKNNQQIIIGGAIVFRDHRGKRQFLLVKQKEDQGWEIPKVTVRKGESSVRAVIRMTGEQAGITAKVLEEAGRASGSTILNGKSIPQKYFYYLMMQRAVGGETIGFNDYQWLDYQKAFKKLELKKEKDIFKDTKSILKEWEKTKRHKMEEEEKALLLQQEGL